MGAKQVYIDIYEVCMIEVGEDAHIVHTRDGQMLCRSWRVVELGGRPFLVLDEPQASPVEELRKSLKTLEMLSSMLSYEPPWDGVEKLPGLKLLQ